MSVWANATQISDPNEFDATLTALEKRGGRVFLLLTGFVCLFAVFVFCNIHCFTRAKDEKTGASWCPDCNDVLPSLRAALEQLKEGHLVIVNVEKANYKVERKKKNGQTAS
jgi:thiol-disulfide isomerase/thioredoxin